MYCLSVDQSSIYGSHPFAFFFGMAFGAGTFKSFEARLAVWATELDIEISTPFDMKSMSSTSSSSPQVGVGVLRGPP